MTADASSQPFDVVLVGSGLSATYTTIRLLERLLADETHHGVRIATVERASDFHTGIPYGERSGTNALLITSLKEFIPSPEREMFTQWLNDNRHWMLDAFRQNAGVLSADWLKANHHAMETGAWEDLYVPRYLFGLFLKERVGTLLAEAEQQSVATHVCVHAEAVDVVPMDGLYEISLSGGVSTLQARSVVLAVGMPVPLSQFSTLPADAAPSACLVDDPYLPTVLVTMERVRQQLRHASGGTVLLIGANASTMEMLFRFNDDAEISSLVTKFYVASPKGSLPERLVDPDPSVHFVARHLEALLDAPGLSARGVYQAALQDIAEGTAQHLTISDTLTPIFQAMAAVVKQLSRDEKLEFAGVWGSDLGRVQRRAGTEYSDLVESLQQIDHLEVLSARFVGLGSGDEAGVRVRYTAGSDAVVHEYPTPMTVIVNCSGSGSLNAAGAAGIVESLVKRGLVRVNASARGLELDDSLQAHDNLYVVGPLMSGNVIAESPVWHMEHCGRIISYGGVLANILVNRL
jgi:uncharacterized NAD(P)/FAD-binding protein YdhS